MPETPMSDSAARTSSSLNGLMIAVTSFISCLPRRTVVESCYADASGFAAFVPWLRTPRIPRKFRGSSAAVRPAPLHRSEAPGGAALRAGAPRKLRREIPRQIRLERLGVGAFEGTLLLE